MREEQRGIKKRFRHPTGQGWSCILPCGMKQASPWRKMELIVYQESQRIDSWTAADFSEEYFRIMEAYEAQFFLYRDEFQEFSWKQADGDGTVWGRGTLKESASTGNGETVTQLWSLEDGSSMRVDRRKEWADSFSG